MLVKIQMTGQAALEAIRDGTVAQFRVFMIQRRGVFTEDKNIVAGVVILEWENTAGYLMIT